MSNNSSSATKTLTQNAPEGIRGNFYTPRVDIYETDKELLLYAEVPGVKPEDVDLRYERGELLLHARVQRPEQSVPLAVNEFGIGDFYRAFQIHESIDSSKIHAECCQGILTVHLPKSESVQPRQIQVRGE